MQANRVDKILRLLGANQISHRANRIQCSCPFATWTHSGGTDDSPSFQVKMSSGAAYFKCFACGRSGHIRKLIWEHMRLSRKACTEAMVLAYDPFDEWEESITVYDYRPGGFGPARTSESTRSKNEAAVRLTGDSRVFSPVSQSQPSTQGYLGVYNGPRRVKRKSYNPPTERQIKRFLEAPIPEYVFKMGFSELSYRAWMLGNDERNRRWVFPIRLADGELFGTTARLYWEKDYCFKCGKSLLKYPDDPDPDKRKKLAHRCDNCGQFYTKYFHWPGMQRHEVLYGLNMYTPDTPIVLVEGTTDAIRLWDYGVRTPMAMLGNNPNVEQVELALSLSDQIFVMGDGDKGGDVMNEGVCTILRGRDREGTVIPVPMGKDPGKMTKDEVAEIVPDVLFDD